jgi:glycosyltransferase involved in cell wall biosynthesis
VHPSLLVVSRWLPTPPDNGARIRREQLIGALADQYDLDYVALLDEPPPQEFVDAVPARVHFVPQPPFNAASLRSRVALLGRIPRAVTTTHSSAAAHLLHDLVRERRPVAIVADEIHTAHYAVGRGVHHEVPVVLEEVQLGQLADARTLRDRVAWWKNRDYHRRMLHRVAVATAPSTVEATRVRRIAPRARVEVISNGVDLMRLRPDPAAAVDAETLVYAGSPQYAANLDAVVWFGQEVLPRVRAARPGVRLVVTGAHDGVVLPEFAGVEFIGRVDDVAGVIRSAACSVVPLRVGGGTRIKVLESLALGTPVVSTSKGVEGLALVDGVEVVVADDPIELAARITDVLSSPERRHELAARGLLAAARHSWGPIRQGFVELVGEVARSG